MGDAMRSLRSYQDGKIKPENDHRHPRSTSIARRRMLAVLAVACIALVGCVPPQEGIQIGRSSLVGAHAVDLDKSELSPRIAQITVAISPTDNRTKCTAVFISESLLLTAAHCVHGVAEKTLKNFDFIGNNTEFPSIGVSYYQFQSEGKPVRIGQTVEKLVIHHGYNPAHRINNPHWMDYLRADLAILRLRIPAKFAQKGRQVSRLALGTDYVLEPFDKVLALGFGANQAVKLHDDPKPTYQYEGVGTLRHKIFEVLPRLPRWMALRFGDAEPDAFHLTPPPSQPKGSVCHGDSGGPIVVNVDGVDTIVGIISYDNSPDCVTGRGGRSLTGMISVAYHARWISDAIKKLR